MQKTSSSCTCANQNLYALKILKSHGLPTTSIYNVCWATLLIVSHVTYAAPACYGFSNSAEKDRLEALLNKATRWGLNVTPAPQLHDIIKSADQKLFGKILSCASHVLHSFLPPVKHTSQRLRRRAHNRILPIKTSSTERNFIIRILYS